MYSFAGGEGVNSPIIIRLTKSRRMELPGRAARIGERRGTYRVGGGTWRKETTWKT